MCRWIVSYCSHWDLASCWLFEMAMDHFEIFWENGWMIRIDIALNHFLLGGIWCICTAVVYFWRTRRHTARHPAGSCSRLVAVAATISSPWFLTHRIHGAGIYANIWGILMVHVTIYGIHGSYGSWNNLWLWLTVRHGFSMALFYRNRWWTPNWIAWWIFPWRSVQ